MVRWVATPNPRGTQAAPGFLFTSAQKPANYHKSLVLFRAGEASWLNGWLAMQKKGFFALGSVRSRFLGETDGHHAHPETGA